MFIDKKLMGIYEIETNIVVFVAPQLTLLFRIEICIFGGIIFRFIAVSCVVSFSVFKLHPLTSFFFARSVGQLPNLPQFHFFSVFFHVHRKRWWCRVEAHINISPPSVTSLTSDKLKQIVRGGSTIIVFCCHKSSLQCMVINGTLRRIAAGEHLSVARQMTQLKCWRWGCLTFGTEDQYFWLRWHFTFDWESRSRSLGCRHCPPLSGPRKILWC